MMPSVFLGHGSPMHIVQEDSHSEMLKSLANEIEKPKAILVISAHWYTSQFLVSGLDQPNQIFDFYGFPKELYEVDYKPKGAMPYIKRTLDLLREEFLRKDLDWGIDHGAWAILKHMYPKADIPVFQLSIQKGLSFEQHFELAKELRPLSKEGVLIIGSGNIVHNLSKIAFEKESKSFDWALEFEEKVINLIENKDIESILNIQKFKELYQKNVPTPEHFIPLIYVLAQSLDLKLIYKGIENRSISMASFITK